MAGDQPETVLGLDGDILNTAGLGQGLHILGLIYRNGGELLQAVIDLPHQLHGSLMDGGGHLIEGHIVLSGISAKTLQIFGLLKNIHFVCYDDHRTLCKFGRILCQLLIDGLQIFHRIASFTAGYVYDVNNEAAAINVPEKVVAKADTLGGTFNNAGNVCHYKALALAQIDNTQIGEQCSKVIVGDFRMGAGNYAQ